MNETIFVTDAEEIKKINQDFREARKEINKRIFESIVDEENREIVSEYSRTFRGTLEEIYPLILTNLFNNYPELQDPRAKRGSYFMVTKHNNHLPIKVTQKNEREVGLLWFGYDGTKYEQKVMITPIKNNKVRVDYFASNKSFRPSNSHDEKRWRKRYIQYQDLNFKLQSTEMLLRLTNNLREVAKLKAKKEKYQQKIDENYQD